MKNLFNELMIQLSLRNVSIKNKLVIAFSALILIFVTTLGTLSYVSSTGIIKEKSIGYTLGILEQVRNNIDINLEQIDLASYLIFSNPTMLSVLKNGQEYFSGTDSSKKFAVDKLMSDVTFSRRDIYSLSVFDKNGRRIDTNFFNPEVNFETISKMADARDGRMAWLDFDEKTSSIPVVRQIRDMEMNLLGYLQINVRESSIRKICSEQIKNMEGRIYVVNGDGTVVSGNDSSAQGQKADQSILARMELKKPGHIIDTVKGKKSIIAFYPSTINDWQYIGVIPLDSITQDAAVVRNMTIFSSLAAIILFILVSYYLAAGLTDPLKAIAGQMKKANIKDWSPQISYQGKDEIAYLAKEFNRMVIRINNLVDEVVEQKSRHSRQELKALQSQINPHFLYNTLEIVNWMARTRNVPEIAEIVKALSDMMRYVTSHKEEIVPIEKEIEYIKMYSLIQMTRYKDKFILIYEIEDEVLDSSIPKLSLQPIIENAIIHAFNGVKRDGKIRVTGKIIDGKVRVQIIDNGRGMSADTVRQMLSGECCSTDSSHAGIGVSNVNRRIKLIFGNEYGMEIVSIPDEGSVFNIWLPISHREDEGNE